MGTQPQVGTTAIPKQNNSTNPKKMACKQRQVIPPGPKSSGHKMLAHVLHCALTFTWIVRIMAVKKGTTYIHTHYRQTETETEERG